MRTITLDDCNFCSLHGVYSEINCPACFVTTRLEDAHMKILILENNVRRLEQLIAVLES